jgi:hypothetical protein
MWTCKKIVFIITLFLIVKAASVSAGEQGNGEHEQAHHYHLNTAEVFIGGTYEDGEHGSENGFSIGLVYERRLNNIFGTGAFYEYTAGDFDKWSIGVPLFIHPYKGWRFALAPGLEHRDSDDEFLFRTGVGYEFELSERWVIIPEFNVDFVDSEESYVFGVSFGFGF